MNGFAKIKVNFVQLIENSFCGYFYSAAEKYSAEFRKSSCERERRKLRRSSESNFPPETTKLAPFLHSRNLAKSSR